MRRTSEALKAQQRAREAEQEAQASLSEITARADRARAERQENHFGPMIWKAMGGK